MCDTSVALGSATAGGHTVFGKNSDRSANEAQPLTHLPHGRHQLDEPLRCQYLTIPQVAETWEVIGSRPWWLWGFEMGVNEWGLAIGNEAVHSKEPHAASGLLGMDLVRLGLERARDADEALAVITGLLERFGQGGSAEFGSNRYYHNSFILADPERAWVLETSGRQWAAQRVRGVRAISNVYTIETEWDAASDGMVEYALERGWWREGVPFNFARAYGDYEIAFAPRNVRYQRACRLLGGAAGEITPATMISYLRDHYEGTELAPRWAPQELLFSSICMHSSAQFPGETAASLVAELRAAPAPLRASVWHAFGSPCLSAYHPVYLGEVGIDPSLDRGSNRFAPDSPWWQFERLQRTVDADPSLAPLVHDALRSLERRWQAGAAEMEAAARTRRDAGDDAGARRLLRRFVDRSLDQLMNEVVRLQRQLESSESGWIGLQDAHRAALNEAAALPVSGRPVPAS